jgi:chemotaxis protein MotB
MKNIKFFAYLIIGATILLTSGCADELGDLRIRNAQQDDIIKQLRSDLQTQKLTLEMTERKLGTVQTNTQIEVQTAQQKAEALQKQLDDKNGLISQMQQQLIYGGAVLPVELSTLLEDFAKDQELVTYDSSRGMVKFKSDLLFSPGSDIVVPGARDAVKALCDILNTDNALNFDVIIAGHTDDIPIGKPETRAKHPTNWHLASHRAISVLKMMENDGLTSDRLSSRGFGEFRPIAPNKPNKKGNPQNRRVEIYIVAKGI